MAPADAECRGLNDGDRVRIWSQRGETFMPVRIDIRIKTGEPFATFLTAGVFLNKLTSAHPDTFNTRAQSRRGERGESLTLLCVNFCVINRRKWRGKISG